MGLLVKVTVIGDDMFYQIVNEQEEFKPKVQYTIINTQFNVCVIAYSDKSKEDLHKFIETNRHVGFTIKDRDGSIAGVLEPQFLQSSTILYNEI